MKYFLHTISILFLTIAIGSAGFGQLVLNEGTNKNASLISDEDGDFESWIELYNNGPATINLLNYGLSDDSLEYLKWQFPNVQIEPSAYLLVYISGKDRKPLSTIDHWEQPVKEDVLWKYIVPNAATPTSWKNTGYDDALWNTGEASVGYGDGDDNSLVASGTKSVYLRYEFSIDDTSKIANALFSIDYDDGFVAYLNGHVIALNGFDAGSPAYNAYSGVDHEAAMYGGGAPENFLLEEDSIKAWINNGTNTLAVEVHNASAASSDLTAKPYLAFAIKDETILWFGDLPAWFPTMIVSSNLHTNFKINSEGETIYLANAAGALLDELFVDILDPDYSVGCITDASPINGIFSSPTPGGPNGGTVYAGYVETVAGFNLDAGFYDAEQTILITAPPGSEIHFTLDGEIPTAFDPLYTGPLPITATTVVKARVFDPFDFYLPGKVSTNTYFIGENISVPVFSITTDDENLYGADGIFDNWGTDWKKPAYIEYFDSVHYNAFEQNVAVKVDGGAGGSRSLDQKSMRIETDHNAYGDGTLHYPLINRKWFVGDYETFYLRNGSNMSNTLPYKDAFMVRTTEGTYNEHMAYEPCVVFINGEYWGFYELREKLDEGHFDHAKGIDKSNLDLLSLSFWYGLVLRTLSGSDTDFVEMRNYLGTYPTPEDSDFYTIANAILDLNNFTDYIAAETWFANYDWPYNNIKVWRDRGGDNKWKYAIIDVELGLGIGGWSDETSNLIGGLFYSQEYIEPLANLLKNPVYHDYFVNRYADLMNSTFLPSRTLAMEDSIYDGMIPELTRQFIRWGYGPLGVQLATFNDYRDALRDDFEVRSDYVRNQIENEFDLNGQVNITLNCSPPEAGRIKISTLRIFDTPWTGIYFDGVPVQITAEPNTGYSFSHWGENEFITDTLIASFLNNISADANFTAYFTGAPAPELITVSEVNYNSEATVDAGNWIELFNYGPVEVNISGWKIKDGNPIDTYVIPENSILAPGERFVIAADMIRFQNMHPDVLNVTGPLGFGLDNTIESISLYDLHDALKLQFTYADDIPWPGGADGQGRTMELVSPAGDLNDPANWFDGCIGGSPGLPYTPCNDALIFSEINYHSGGLYPADDWIEIRNISDTPVNIGGWKFMDDSVGITHEFIIPDGRTIDPHSNWVLAQSGAKFNSAYPWISNFDSSFVFDLGNGGEWIRMYDQTGKLALSVNYSDETPWPFEADGGGYAAEIIDSLGLMNSGYNWISICPGGSPGRYTLEPCGLEIEENDHLKGLSIYPNPAHDYLQITINSTEKNNISLNLLSIDGKYITNFYKGNISSTTMYNFNIHNLPAGIYFIQLISGSDVVVEKFVKQ